MCYMVRHPASELPAGDGVAPSPVQGLRPRWAAAGAAMLVAGVALAATLVSPPAGPERLQARDSGAPATMATRAGNVPIAGGVEQTALPMDDGVPAPADTSTGKAAFGHCHGGF